MFDHVDVTNDIVTMEILYNHSLMPTINHVNGFVGLNHDI